MIGFYFFILPRCVLFCHQRYIYLSGHFPIRFRRMSNGLHHWFLKSTYYHSFFPRNLRGGFYFYNSVSILLPVCNSFTITEYSILSNHLYLFPFGMPIANSVFSVLCPNLPVEYSLLNVSVSTVVDLNVFLFIISTSYIIFFTSTSWSFLYLMILLYIKFFNLSILLSKNLKKIIIFSTHYRKVYQLYY